MKNVRFIIITGLSGSGKSYAIKCFEDLGFFCIDNLPTTLLLKFAELSVQSESDIKKIALGIDVRERDFFKDTLRVFEEMKQAGYNIEILFLETSDEVLVRRYSETRRKHPLAKNKSVLEGIHLERKQLGSLREIANKIIDTSNYTVHDLKKAIKNYYLKRDKISDIAISLVSFGYKYGIPYDADLIFDVRFLPNPYFIDKLKLCTGKDKEVREYVLKKSASKMFLKELGSFLKFLIPLYIKEGKAYLTIAIGCTGGRHRSVTIVDEVKNILQTEGYNIQTINRNLR